MKAEGKRQRMQALADAIIEQNVLAPHRRREAELMELVRETMRQPTAPSTRWREVRHRRDKALRTGGK